MTSKYSNLPDIDTAADIYETEENVASGSGTKDYNSDDDFLPPTATPSKLPPGTEINSSRLPTREQVGGVFGRRSKGVREKKEKDGSVTLSYRPRLPPIPKSLRPTSASYTSHPPSSSSSEDDTPSEAPAARLRRLRWEMDELERELLGQQKKSVESAGEEGVSGGKKGRKEPSREELLKELLGMKSGLQRISAMPVGEAGGEGKGDDLVTRLERLGMGGGGEGQGGEVGAGKVGGSVSEVDKRLEVLESTIGSGTGSDESLALPQPILPTLQRLEHLLSILAQPRQLDNISRRIKVLLTDLDKAAAASSSNPTNPKRSGLPSSEPSKDESSTTISPADQHKLDSLFALLPRIDPLLPILPPLLVRLRSLSHLHASSSTFLSGLERLEAESGQIREGEKELQEVMERVEKGLGVMGEGVKENWKGLEGRLGEIDRRLKALNGS